MDYHFYNSPVDARNQAPVRFGRVLFTFFPLFVAAALLPVFLGLVRNPVTIRQNAQADQNDLTVWIEPANVIAKQGTPVTLTVIGLYDGGKTLLPGVSAVVSLDGAIASIQNASVKYAAPFSGQVELGKVVVTPQKTGEITVLVDTQQVFSQTAQVQPNVFTSSAKIVVQ